LNCVASIKIESSSCCFQKCDRKTGIQILYMFCRFIYTSSTTRTVGSWWSQLDSHGSSPLQFKLKLTVWYFVSDSEKVMTMLICCVTFKVLWRKREYINYKFLSTCMLPHPMETSQMPICQRSSSSRLSYMDSPGWLQVSVMNPASSKQLRSNIHNTYIRASISEYHPSSCFNWSTYKSGEFTTTTSKACFWTPLPPKTTYKSCLWPTVGPSF